MSICCNVKQRHTCFFLNHVSDKTVFWSNGLWIYYFSLKSNLFVNMDTLAVHLCHKYPRKFYCVLQHTRTLWIGSRSNLLGLIRKWKYAMEKLLKFAIYSVTVQNWDISIFWERNACEYIYISIQDMVKLVL